MKCSRAWHSVISSRHIRYLVMVTKAVDENYIILPKLKTSVPAVMHRAAVQRRVPSAHIKPIKDIIDLAAVELEVVLVSVPEGKSIHILVLVSPCTGNAELKVPL